MKKEYFFSTNSFSLHTVCYTPKTKAKGVLQIIHGISEHFGRYHHFASHLCDKGFIVIGCDLPGHGKSVTHEDDFGFFSEENGWNLVAHSLNELVEENRNEYSHLPFFLFGHSMGSFLVRTLMINNSNLADGILLSGTAHVSDRFLNSGHSITKIALQIAGPRGKNQLLDDFFMGHHFLQFHTALDWISSNEQTLNDYLEDPLTGHQPTVGLLRDLIDGLTYMQDPVNISKVNKDTPIYLFSGDGDPVGENSEGVLRAEKAFKEAGCHNVTCKIYEGGRHEMLNESNRLDVYHDILNWLDIQLHSLQAK